MERRGVLVTGATGFIGRNLARSLRAKGIPVAAIVRPSSNVELLQSIGVSCHAHDGDADHLAALMDEIAPTTVYHLASRFVAEHRPADIESLIGTNLHFSTQLVDAMARTGVDRLVNAGTSWESLSNAVAEPSCLYAATKAAFGHVLDFYRSAHSLRVVTLRLYDTFGPDDDRPKLMALLKRFAASGEPLAMSAGAQKICPLFISDVVTGFQQAAAEVALLAPGEGHLYALPGPECVTLREFVARFARACGKAPEIRWGERPYRAREVMEPWRGPVLPGWQAQVSLDEGLRLTLEGAPGV
ncbi:MAG TPA: NAD(P)-dependent oxidoreductase [Rhizobium sp.]|nr:NAD(P)-dependent oxidoreductase [Rhizobium sp.]